MTDSINADRPQASSATDAPPTAPGDLGKPPREVRPDAHLRPPRWLTVWTVIETLAALVWLVFALLEFTRPGSPSGTVMLYFLLGLPLAFTWAVRAVLLLIWGVRDRPAPRRCVLPGLLAGVVPLAGFLGFASVSTDEDFVARFSLLEDKLGAEADAIRASGTGVTGAFRVGLMPVERAHLGDDGAVSFVLRDEWDFFTRIEERAVQLAEGTDPRAFDFDAHADGGMYPASAVRPLGGRWYLVEYWEEF